jgi:hypothetical protein
VRTSTLVLAVACVVVLTLVAGTLLLSNVSFSLGNPRWDGISSVALNGRTVPIGDFGQLPQEAAGDTLLIIGPSAGYSEQDARDVASFLLNGGRALVMDDYGTANTLLDNISSPIRISPVPLCQDVDFYRSPALPLVGGIVCDRITGNVSVLAFNHPVPLNLSGDALPLAATSSKGWLDGNDNATMDDNETFGSYTLVARAGYGNGELIVAGDADLITNGLLKKGDNSVLLGNIMGSGTVFVDTGHGQQVPPLASLYYILKNDLPAQALCVFAILAAAGACALLGRRRARKPQGEDNRSDARRSLIAAMKEKLPLSERDIKVLNKKL